MVGYFKILFFYIILSVIVRFPSLFFDFFSHDEAAHFIGSVVVERGGILYKEFVDNKPPMVYLLYLISRKLFFDDMFSVHLFTTVILIPIIAFLIFLFSLEVDRSASIISGILYIIFSTTFIPVDMLATNCEIPMLFFSSLFFLFIKRVTLLSFFFGGVFLTLAFLAKQQAGIYSFVPFVFFIINYREIGFRKIFSLLLAFFFGILFVAVSTLLYFYKGNALNEFIYYIISHNILYSQNPLPYSEVFKRMFKYFLPYLVVISPLIYFYVANVSELSKKIKDIMQPGFLLSIIPSFIGLRFFPHYYLQILPPLSILSSFYLSKNRNYRTPKLFWSYSFLLVFGFNIYTMISYSRHTKFIEETHPAFSKVPVVIKKLNSCIPNETVFVWGYAPLFYYYFYKQCKMLPASRFILPQASISGYIPGNEYVSAYHPELGKRYIIKRDRELLINDLKKNRPLLVIDTSPAKFHHYENFPLDTFPELKSLISEKSYLRVNVEQFEVYILKK